MPPQRTRPRRRFSMLSARSTPLSATFRAAAFALAALSAAALSPAALAAPRVGTHDGYTRLVFNLPARAQASSSTSGASLTVRLNTALRTEQGALHAPGVTGYAVSSRAGTGSTVTVTLSVKGRPAKVSVYGASGGQPARLVIDVPSSGTPVTSPRAATAQSVPATPQAASGPSISGAAQPTAVTRPASTAVQRPRVVIDAGHGGVDPGMTSRWVTEKQVTLDVALRLQAELKEHGVDVIMVRETDRDLSQDKATDLNARSRLATTGTVSAYISIHVNAGNPSAQGIETYYFGKSLAGGTRSLAVFENGGGSTGEELTRRAATTAQSMLGDILSQAKISFSRQLAQRVQSRLVAATGAINRGVATDAFYVIRNPTTPAILTEIGFGSSPVEGPKLASPEYRERIAQAIARAILDFLNTK